MRGVLFCPHAFGTFIAARKTQAPAKRKIDLPIERVKLAPNRNQSVSSARTAVAILEVQTPICLTSKHRTRTSGRLNVMAQSIISKEELLENAYEIAEEGGISALSIRGLATKSGVSVGTVYRFFAAKDELTIATIELYFARAFYKEFCHLDAHTAFVDYCEKMNVSMHQVFNHFREYWLRGAEALPSAERAAARLRESQQIEHVVNGLVEIYKHDPNIVADLPDGFTPRSVCEFILDNVLDSLRNQNGDCKVLFGLLRSTLYKSEE